MKTNFIDYLEKKKAQQIIDRLALKPHDKKIIIFGAGLFAGDLFRHYDLSKLNIIGACDKSFQENPDGDYYGYKKFSPLDLLEADFDILLITEYDDSEIKKYLKKELFQGENIKFKIRTLVKLSLIEYIKDTINGDL